MLWLRWLDRDEDDPRLVWLRANEAPWKLIFWALGISRAKPNRRWQYGIAIIVYRLNGKVVSTKRSNMSSQLQANHASPSQRTSKASE
jgi:hypothetical protein